MSLSAEKCNSSVFAGLCEWETQLIPCAKPWRKRWAPEGDTRLVLNRRGADARFLRNFGLVVRFLASTKQRGGNVKLVQPSKFAVQTLRLVGVLNLFEVFDDDAAAVESF
jgi:hypothetical protein